jgi:plasmid rolling circle replication initiator protein Rep
MEALFENAWAWLLAAASAIVLLTNAADKIVMAIKAAKAPNAKQDERITALEAWKKEVDAKLENDLHRLDSIEAGNRASHQALLALLDHSLDGNNIEQMQHAKETLQQHLINR